ncbi:hypothetical protein D3C80_1174600 [compost metagenome]
MAALRSHTETKLKPISDEAKAWKTVWSAGQGVGAIDKLCAVEQLINCLDTEYRQAQASAKALSQHWPG